jgi:hypothetical protein
MNRCRLLVLAGSSTPGGLCRVSWWSSSEGCRGVRWGVSGWNERVGSWWRVSFGTLLGPEITGPCSGFWPGWGSLFLVSRACSARVPV